MAAPKSVFVTGATGYMGRRLIARLVERGHEVAGLARPGSESRLPAGCEVVIGDALRGATFCDSLSPAHTLVHLVGVSHPSPSKADQFERVDLVSVGASLEAAGANGLRHFVYVSVARPAPVMKAYQSVRARCEEMIRDSGIPATFLRPWYVLGPGHRWPYALVPIYALLERIPATRERALRLGLVTIDQMIAALVHAVESPPDGVVALDVPRIRQRIA
jgi:uncharacterized protein YbjT (DUF2867 family)